jgi:hypothetical protein
MAADFRATLCAYRHRMACAIAKDRQDLTPGDPVLESRCHRDTGSSITRDIRQLKVDSVLPRLSSSIDTDPCVDPPHALQPTPSIQDPQRLGAYRHATQLAMAAANPNPNLHHHTLMQRYAAEQPPPQHYVPTQLLLNIPREHLATSAPNIAASVLPAQAIDGERNRVNGDAERPAVSLMCRKTGLRPRRENLSEQAEELFATALRARPMGRHAAMAVAERCFRNSARLGATFGNHWLSNVLQRQGLSTSVLRTGLVKQKDVTKVANDIGQAFTDARHAVRLATARLRAFADAGRHDIRELPPSHIFQLDELNIYVGLPKSRTAQMRHRYIISRGSTSSSRMTAKPFAGETRTTATLVLVSNLDASFLGGWLVFGHKDKRWPRVHRGNGDLACAPLQVMFSNNRGVISGGDFPMLIDSILSMRRDGVPAILLYDNAPQHHHAALQELFNRHDGSIVVHLPSNCSGLVQPHDLGLNHLFRQTLDAIMKRCNVFAPDDCDTASPALDRLFATYGLSSPMADAASQSGLRIDESSRSAHEVQRDAIVQCTAQALLTLRDRHRSVFPAIWRRSGLAAALGYSHVQQSIFLNCNTTVSTDDVEYPRGPLTAERMSAQDVVAQTAAMLPLSIVQLPTHHKFYNANNNHGNNGFDSMCVFATPTFVAFDVCVPTLVLLSF